MYETFFGLKEKPFSLTPDTEYLYRFSGHQEALNVLLVALRNGEGFMRVSGEVGTGKTLLCRQVIKVLENDCVIAYLPNPLLTPLELYQAISSELGLQTDAEATLQQLCLAIFAKLVELKKTDQQVVVLIDEAQAMPYQSLEALRLLSNLESEKDKLLHIVFFAQPEFEQRLATSELRQLRQRITFVYELKKLSRREVSAYLDHRLKIAGYQGRRLFSSRASRLLHRASGGVPRLVNLLANKALLAAYGKGAPHISASFVKRAIADTPGLSGYGADFGRRYALECGLVVVVAILTLWILKGMQ